MGAEFATGIITSAATTFGETLTSVGTALKPMILPVLGIIVAVLAVRYAGVVWKAIKGMVKKS